MTGVRGSAAPSKTNKERRFVRLTSRQSDDEGEAEDEGGVCVCVGGGRPALLPFNDLPDGA